MEGSTGELTTTTTKHMTASLSSPIENPKIPQQQQQKLSLDREEGELSSSDCENDPTLRSGQSGATPAKSMPPIRGKGLFPPVNTWTQKRNLSYTQPRPIQANSWKNQVQLRSTNSAGSGRLEADSNLVIRFSDDDSSSESDTVVGERETVAKPKSNSVDGKKTPLASSSEKPKELSQIGRSTNKVTPRKSVFSRTFNVPGNSREVSRVDHQSQVNKINTFKRNLGDRERQFDQSVVLGYDLQDLRQQIREKELKLMASQKNKESDSVFNREYNAINQSDVAYEPKQLKKKRLKVGESSACTQIISGAGLEKTSADSDLSSKQLLLGNVSLRKKNMAEDKRGTSPSRKESSLIKSQNQGEKPVDVPPENVLGTDVRTSCSQLNRVISQAVPYVKYSQAAVQGVKTLSTLPDDTHCAELNKFSIVEHNRPNSPLYHKGREHDSARSTEYHEVFNYQASKPSSSDRHKVSLSNRGPWNGLGNTSVTGHNIINTQPSVEFEKAVDKELGEAQQYRHICEIEERKALRAYREAQRSLIEANTRCADLYRKREMCSANFSTFLMDNSGFYGSLRQPEDARTGIVSSKGTTGDEDTIPMPHIIQLENGGLNQPESALNIQFNSGPPNMREDEATIPMPQKTQLENGGLDQPECDLNIQCDNSGPPDMPYQRINAQNLGSEKGGLNQPECDLNIQCTNSGPHKIQLENGDLNQPECDLNIQCASSGPPNMPYKRINAQNLGSENCSDPDTSTSEQLLGSDKHVPAGTNSPSCIPDTSGDEDEETLHHRSVQCNLEGQGQGKSENEGAQMIKNIDNELISAVGLQDSVLLEAKLRSELFERLGKRTSKGSGLNNCVEPFIKRGPESNPESGKGQMSDDSAAKKYQQYGGTDRPRGSISEASVQIQEQLPLKKNPSKQLLVDDPEGNEVSSGGDFSLMSSVFSDPLLLRSTLSHLKMIVFPTSLTESQTTVQNESFTLYNDEAKCSDLKESSVHEIDISPYLGDLKLDHSWPLCLYDLRGKCNNDECPWQHTNVDNADITNSRRTEEPILSRDISTSTYLVGLDILKVDSQAYKSSVVVRSNGQCWQKVFSICLAASSFLHIDLSAEERLLEGDNGRIEIHGIRGRHYSYLQSTNGDKDQLKQSSDAAVDPLEMPLLIINKEVNSTEDVIKALDLLSRSLETDSTSEILWILYLLIYHMNTKAAEQDDMFSRAVKHNSKSYVLWLFYVNSRKQLRDRLAGYEAALSALCLHESTSKTCEAFASSCILDMLLQMLDCFCMSGNVEKAIQRIHGILNTKEPHFLKCLTFSDKCVFWICCMYLVIYRKLPDAVLQRLEFDKELHAIVWPSINLVCDEKARALKTVERAVESAELCIKNMSFGSESDRRSVELFALNHLRCMVALNDLEYSRKLLHKYAKLHPSCIDFALMSARMKHDGFEEVLSKWPKEDPRIHCLWNQYAEFVLRNGRYDFAKELMARWFNSVWRVQNPVNKSADVVDTSLLDSSNSDNSGKFMDLVFGFLNLAIHNILQDDRHGANAAVNRALQAVGPNNFVHCMREHMTFSLSSQSQQLSDGIHLTHQLSNLKRYLDHASSFPKSEPLSRRFINKIENSKVKQLFCNLLCPISSDYYSVLNMVLEANYGPSLISTEKLKDFVDFVEAILDLVPSNYQLAFSVHKLLSNTSSNAKDNLTSLHFWASVILTNAIFQAVPLAPEYIFVEAADLLNKISGKEAISDKFHKQALTVYPFSKRLWQSYHDLSKKTGDPSSAVGAAKNRGISLD